MLPQVLLQSKDAHVRRMMQQLVWLHTIESTRRLFRLVEDGRASIQQVTISHTGGALAVSFPSPLRDRLPACQTAVAAVGGSWRRCRITHLATCSDRSPHHRRRRTCAQPRPLGRSTRAAESPRPSRCPMPAGIEEPGQAARPAGTSSRHVAATRKMAHHMLANQLARPFDTVVIEDLNVAGMTHNRPLARALADVGSASSARSSPPNAPTVAHNWSRSTGSIRRRRHVRPVEQ